MRCRDAIGMVRRVIVFKVRSAWKGRGAVENAAGSVSQGSAYVWIVPYVHI